MVQPTVRPTAVAGTFYPGQRTTLVADLEHLLAEDNAPAAKSAKPLRALIVPHAGYMFSGAVAATGYRLLARQRAGVKRILLLGPSHRVPLRGIALPNHTHFRTPLADIPLDIDALASLQGLPGVNILPAAHALEHSLEVHLPFLQTVLDDFQLIPLVVGEIAPAQLAELVESLWNDDTFLVVSSDLSHFLTYDEATTQDRHTSDLIESRCTTLHGEQACGCNPINGLMHLAAARKLGVKTLDLRNSGDTAGGKDRVVGYGTYGLY